MTAAPVLARTLKYKISVTNGANAGQNLVFEQPLLKIGRGPENDLVFSNDPKMSRSHAELHCHLGQLMIRNVSQRNYILVNGERVEEKTLSGLGLVQIGETLLQIQLDQPPDAAPTSVPVSSGAVSPSPLAPIVSSVSNSVANPVSQPMSRPSGKAVPASQVQNQSPRPQPHMPPPQQSNAVFGGGGRHNVQINTGGSSRFKLYAIVIVLGVLGYWLFEDSGKSKKPEVNIRTEGDVARAIEDSAKAVQELKKQQQTSGQDSIQYRSAQEHYIKGFRDYRQGQYARAMQSLQAALSFYPSHELARKYLIQSQRKFEEQVDRHMSQGRKYYQRQNYKMCQSSFASVMIMVKDSTKPKYKEAKQFYDECNLRTEGGY